MNTCGPCSSSDHIYCYAGQMFREAVGRGGFPYKVTAADMVCACDCKWNQGRKKNGNT